MGLLVVPGSSSASKKKEDTLYMEEGTWRSYAEQQMLQGVSFHVSSSTFQIPSPRIFLGTLCKTQDTLFIVFGRIWNNGRWVNSG